MIGCLDQPTAGRYRVLNREVAGLDADQLAALRRETFGFVFQRYNLLNTALAAAQRVEQARAQAKIAGANLWPAVGLAGDFSNTHNNAGDAQKNSGRLSVAYEVDLWGANRARRDAGVARLVGEVFARDALKLVGI